MSLAGQPGAPPASLGLWQPPCPALAGALGNAFDPVAEPYPVALRGVILSAVGDLGFAVVQDAPDDRNAGHLLSAADQVLRLLKGHYSAGCEDPGTGQGALPSVVSQHAPSFLAPPSLQESACHASPRSRKGMENSSGKGCGAGTLSS